MSLDTQRVEAVTFDSFTTLVDVLGTTTRVLGDYIENEDAIPAVVSLWRFRAVEYRMLCNSVGTYETYEETTRDALEYALAAEGVDLPDSAVEEIVSRFHHLDVYEDVHDSIEHLDEIGCELYIVSNGTQDLLQSIVTGANIGEFIADTISADDIQTYKPEIEFYRHAANQTNTHTENILHVATPWYDIYGANNAGMQTIWVNRDDKPWEKFEGEPDRTLASLRELPPLFEQ